MCSLRKISLSLLLLLVLPGISNALPIEDFDGLQTVETTTNQDVFGAVQSSTAIGLNRGIKVSKLTGAVGGVRFLIGGGLGSHSQDSVVTGSSMIVWDGDTINGVNPTGLGGIDLTQDNGSSFKIEVLSFDFPQQKPLTLRLTIYDASDLNGNRSLTATYVLNQQINEPTIIEIPFSSFTQQGVDGPASFQNVGAVSLAIDGTVAKDADLTMDKIFTNGFCNLFTSASNKRVVDVCGVCGGDGTSCLDCKGVPFGSAKIDRCNVCDGDGTSCITCEKKDIAPLLTTMDGGAKLQEKIVIRAAQKLRGMTTNAKIQKFADSSRITAHSLQIQNWVLSWQIPHPSVSCNATPFCVATSNASKVSEYNKRSNDLRLLVYKLVAQMRKIRGASRTAGAAYLKSADKQHQRNVANSAQVPAAHFSCS